MKRLLWCLCLCSLCPTFITGCGDDEGGGGSEDGGVSPADLDDINNSITEITDQLDGLGTDVEDLGTQLDGLDGDLTELTNDVQGRLDALEDPEILSCSVEELCIPDGLVLSTAGIADIIELVCEHEVDCCTEAELNLKFGPAITTAAQCVDLFTDVVNNGLSPDFLQESPYIVNQIIGVAQALNDPRVHVELNADGIAECVDSLRERECPEYVEGEIGEPECIPYEAPESDPCALGNLLTGMQEEGELCGNYGGGYSYFYSIPECKEGLFCSWEGGNESNEGLCAKLPEEGDGCQRDYDCDPNNDEGGFSSTFLYCNLDNAECEPLGEEGDPCAFINDDFTISDGNLNPYSRSATSQDCMPGLTCDPTSNTCVGACNEGYFCNGNSEGGDPLTTCGEGRVCNVTEYPKLLTSFGLGICTDALDEGDTCTATHDECGTGACSEDCDLDTGTCTCGEALKQPGEDCDEPGPDALCSNGVCGADSTCVSFCDCDPNAGDNCDWIVDEYGRDPIHCDDGSYCDIGLAIINPDLSVKPSGYACQVLIENGELCDPTNGSLHASCESGYCDPDPGRDDVAPYNVCAPKQADTTDGACLSGYDQECPVNQYCNTMQICKPYVALNGPCDLAAVPPVRCAEGTMCVDAATDSCQAYAGSGDDCSNNGVNEPYCDENLNLSCIDIDGPSGIGTASKCYSYDGGLADGVECQGYDQYCASGWCLPNGPVSPTAYECAQPLAEGDDCDTADITLDKCGPGLFCNHPNGETAGKCAEQHEPGGSCKPYFAGVDCVNGCVYDPQTGACPSQTNPCVFTKDQFLCDSRAQPIESLFCDGN